MTFDQIITELRNKIYRPFYLLYGEEPYFIDVITDEIQDNVLDESEKDFNLSVVYGRDTDVMAVLDLARRHPMMANYHVVIVREAQDLDKPEELQPYFERFLPTTILVIAYKYGKLDRRKAFVKAAEKNGAVFESKKIYDNELPGWISEHVRTNGFTISPDAAELLAEYLGADLAKVMNELGKLTINLPTDTRISPAIIEKYIGISKEYNVFELQKALGRRDIMAANRIVNYFGDNPKDNSPVMVTAVLYGWFSKLLIYHQLHDTLDRKALAAELSINPFFLKDYEEAARNISVNRIHKIMGILRDYDLKAKGAGNVTTSEGGLLKEMIYKMLH